MRKFISVLLVVVLVLAMTSMAFAVNPSQYTGGGGGGGGGGAAATTPSDTTTQTMSDGTTVTTKTTTDADGNKIKDVTTTAPDGTVTQNKEVEISDKAAAAATDGTVTAPVSVTATKSIDTAPQVKVTLPSGASNVDSIEIPVTNASDNTVAYLVNADGSTTLIRDSLLTDDGIVIPATGNGVTVKIVNNDKTYVDDNAVSSWAKPGVEFATSHELFIGNGSGYIDPKEKMTVGQAAAMVSRMANKNLNTRGSKWYQEPMSWINSQGMNPTGSAYTANITRQLFGHMVWVLAGSPESNGSFAGFTDGNNVEPQFVKGLKWCVENGIIKGEGKLLNPYGEASREEIMTMDKRYYEAV